MRPLPSPTRVIVAWLRAGKTITWITGRSRLTPTTIRCIATSIGWHRSWIDYSHQQKRVGLITTAKVLARYDANDTLEEIAQRAQVTRERIRQVVKREGREPRRVLIRRRNERITALKKRTYARRQTTLTKRRRARALDRLRGKVEKAHGLWKQGMLVADIAQRCGRTTASLSALILSARRNLAWFARRRQGTRPTPG